MIDTGTEWIHNFTHTLNGLKCKQGDQLDEQLIPYHLEAAYGWDGEKYKKVPAWVLDAIFKNMPEYKFKILLVMITLMKISPRKQSTTYYSIFLLEKLIIRKKGFKL